MRQVWWDPYDDTGERECEIAEPRRRQAVVGVGGILVGVGGIVGGIAG
ncbi:MULTISPECIES: hypothetical protein [unclassified Kribbella]